MHSVSAPGIRRSTRRASRSRAANFLARAGLTARGVIYILIGWVAVLVALGHSSREADQQGALQMLAGTSYGLVSLWLLAIGFAGYALWRLGSAYHALADAVDAPFVTDHLCWTGAHGVSHHDLLPTPYTPELVAWAAERAAVVQRRLGRPFGLENLSSYVTFQRSTLTEAAAASPNAWLMMLPKWSWNESRSSRPDLCNEARSDARQVTVPSLSTPIGSVPPPRELRKAAMVRATLSRSEPRS